MKHDFAPDGSGRGAYRRSVLANGFLSRIEFKNSTDLPDAPLLALCREGMAGWAVGTVTLRVRYSRGADFSGTCFYRDGRIYINLGRHLVYPYRMATNLARTKQVGDRWYKPSYRLELKEGCQVVLFIFMHELYHLLVKRAKRNIRQKESMCDRFAARFIVDRFGATVRGPYGRRVRREEWDFQDVERFVEAARDRRAPRRPPQRQILPTAALPKQRQEQLLLFSA